VTLDAAELDVEVRAGRDVRIDGHRRGSRGRRCGAAVPRMPTKEEAEQTGRDGKTDSDHDEDAGDGLLRDLAALALGHRDESNPRLDGDPEHVRTCSHWRRSSALRAWPHGVDPLT
jgi:hypothetical protein